jgi:phosphoglycolate phosphatase
MLKYKAILFDLDGTLLDTLKDIGDAANRVLLKRQFPAHPIDSYRLFVGDGLNTLFTRALPPDKINENLVRSCMKEFEQEYSKNWNNETSAYPGVSEMLDLVRSRGLKMSILSNKPHEFTQYCVEAFFPEWEFDIVQGIQASIIHKPDPSGALAIARRLGIAPTSFLYLGDTGTDMQTARAAGMFPIGALWGFRSSEELIENGAKVVISHPMGIEEFCR